ncbi:hypothetical protein LZP69_15640 [Shewanella sp. AS1]|uniref:hypothetical protein n=1 Tax=Shewanella sp. AS1 TaxID=2907626 RepID=UPI001F219C1A|nr:hypothetical protein [Shewanella sp. AS1]MCE9680586.1 hypothetical protein [Shewanella sp. AS1]
MRLLSIKALDIKLSTIMASALMLTLLGCSSSPEQAQSEKNYIEVGNVDYDSLYHYGYNIGCRSAGEVKRDPSLGDVESMKDEVLDGLDSFDDGWEAGTAACEDGISHSMYTVRQSTDN